MLTQHDTLQILSGNADALRQVAASLDQHGQPYRFVRVHNPATRRVTLGIEFSKKVYNAMVGA